MTQINGTLIPVAPTTDRLQSIDALRGFVMALMLVDHIRETFYLHKQVSDPVDALALHSLEDLQCRIVIIKGISKHR